VKIDLTKGLWVVAVLILAGGLTRLGSIGNDNGGKQIDAVVDQSVFGGLAVVAADAVWIWGQDRWEHRDEAGTRKAIRLATHLAPESLYFWINGARIIAYDLPTWPREQAGWAARVYARESLVLLAEVEGRHGKSPYYWIERGSIALNAAQDYAAAAEWFREASTKEHAPFFAARLHGELLERLGRTGEAYRWWRDLHPTLPATDIEAQADLVLLRIRRLEAELRVSMVERYRLNP